MGTFTNFCSRASLLAALVVAGAHTAAAAQPVAQAPVARQMLGVGKGDARALKDIPEAQALVASLRDAMAEQPTLRVIVGVRTAFAPEAALGAQGASSQRSDIARAQTLAIESLPGAFAAKVHRFETIPYFAMDVTSDQLEALLQLPDVTDVQEDQLMSKALGQSGPLISAPSVWSRGYTGAGWAVAVLDDGVQNNHPFLSGRIVHEACFSTQDLSAGTNSSYSLCPNQAASATGANAASQCYAVGSTSCSHGTHVAGIAAGNGSAGGVAYSGVARGGNIIPVQVFSYFSDTTINNVLSWQSDQLKGLEHVYGLRNTYAIAAVNMSLGGGRYTSQATCDSENSGAGSLKAAIDNLRSVGIATVIASGNSGYASATGAPGCISSAITVGATTDVTGQIDTSYSNSASFVDLVAPGSSIDSSVPFGAYANYNGTSMATPQVAGCWAVLKQVRPSASVQQIENALKTTGVSVTDPRNGLTFSRINCDAAAAQLLANPSLTTLTVQKTGSGNVRALGGVIDCGLNCSTTLASSTIVTLVASPAVGYEFLGWSGATGCGFARSCSLSMSASRTVTAVFGAPSVQYLPVTALNQGSLAAATGNVLRYSVTVPEGARNLVVSMSGGSGDADLYLLYGAEPTGSNWDCRPFANGSTESCSDANPVPGTYYIIVYAYSGFSGLTLTATYQLSDLLCTAGSTSLTGAVSDTRSSTYCGTVTLSPSNLGYTANPTARVVVRAGSGVRLSPGFRLYSGALFKAASDTSLQSN